MADELQRGKRKRRRLTAVQHRERARRYLTQAMQHRESEIRRDLILVARLHEALADRLDP